MILNIDRVEQAKSKCSKGVAKCQFGFTFKEVSIGKKESTRPSVNYAKDWQPGDPRPSLLLTSAVFCNYK